MSSTPANSVLRLFKVLYSLVLNKQPKLETIEQVEQVLDRIDNMALFSRLITKKYYKVSKN